MRKNCKTFEEWAESQVDEFTAIKKKSKHLQIVHSVDYNSARYMICNLRNGKTGYGTVKIDNFANYAIVIALAWANYKGEKVPEFRRARLLRMLKEGAQFQTKDGKSYTLIGKNPHNKPEKRFVCVSHAMIPKYIEMNGDDIIYLPR